MLAVDSGLARLVGRIHLALRRVRALDLRQAISLAIVLICSSAALAFAVAPAIYSLPIAFHAGVWLPFPHYTASLAYRYDALSHVLFLLALISTAVSLACPRSSLRSSRGHRIVTVLILVVFWHISAAQDLMMLFLGWQLLILLSAAMLRSNNMPVARSLITSQVAAYGLLAAVVALGSALGGFTMVGELNLGRFVPLLLLVPAFAILGLFPFHHVHAYLAKCDAATLISMGPLALLSAVLLVSRSLQLAGASFPSGSKSLILWYLLLVLLLHSLLAWRSSSARHSLLLMLTGDAALISFGLIWGSLATLTGGLLLLINNVLALASFAALAGQTPSPSQRKSDSQAGLLIGSLAIAGIPPLLGFTARWQLLSGLFLDGALPAIIILIISFVPRSIAALRLRKLSRLGDSASSRGKASRVTLVAHVSVVLLGLFSLLPWIPQRFMVNPSLVALGLPDIVAATTPAPSLAAALASCALLAAALVMAFLTDSEIRETIRNRAGVVWPEVVDHVVSALSVSVHLLLIAVLGYAEHTLSDLWHRVTESIRNAYVRIHDVVSSFEDVYYTAAMFLAAIAIVLAFLG